MDAHMGKATAKKISSSTESRNPRERFVALANSRVTATIHQMRLVGNLSNRKNYEYSSDDASKIIRALQRELDELKSKFKGESKNDSNFFSL